MLPKLWFITRQVGRGKDYPSSGPSGSACPAQLSLVFFTKYCRISFSSHMLCEWFTLSSMRFCVWFCLTIKWRQWCLALKQSSTVSNLSSACAVGLWHLFWVFSPRKQFFQLYLIPRHASPVPDAQLSLLLLLLNHKWCGVAATFGMVAVKDEKICISVPVWTGERRLWWDPKG